MRNLTRRLNGVIAVVGLLLCPAVPVVALDTPPVRIVVDGRMTVKGPGGEGLLPVAVSQDWSQPLPQVRRAVIVVHGAHRVADSLFRSVAGMVPNDATLVIVPQFLEQQDVAAHSLPDSVLRWARSWATGADAAGPIAVSSYDAIDALLLTLGDRSRLPNLTTVVLAGFSGGGWLVQRYAALGHAGDTLAGRGIAVRYLVGSPSSYLYFSDDRPLANGGFAPFAGAAACPGFNRWPYGLAGEMPRYVAAPAQRGAASIATRYAGLDLVYLVGAADNDPNHWELDKSCGGEAEGADRLARGINFFHYMQARYATLLRQRFQAAPGAGHDPAAVLGSPCGRAALFDASGCTGGSSE